MAGLGGFVGMYFGGVDFFCCCFLFKQVLSSSLKQKKKTTTTELSPGSRCTQGLVKIKDNCTGGMGKEIQNTVYQLGE